MQTAVSVGAMSPLDTQFNISARIERLPLTRPVFWLRNIIGAATFFDGYTVLAIAHAMPVLVREWHLTPNQVGMILSSGYLDQLLGAIFFGWLAERVGRLRVLLFTIILFVAMDAACLFAWGAPSMILFRFLQGIGTGGEVAGRERLYQRIHWCQAAGAFLPALRGHVPGRPRRRGADWLSAGAGGAWRKAPARPASRWLNRRRLP
jgi:MFS family permease